MHLRIYNVHLKDFKTLKTNPKYFDLLENRVS